MRASALALPTVSAAPARPGPGTPPNNNKSTRLHNQPRPARLPYHALCTRPRLFLLFARRRLSVHIMSESKVFSLEGKGLKLDTAEDMDKHIKELKDNVDVEEVRFLGNTLGIGASEALAKVLETKKKLQVCLITPPSHSVHQQHTRSQTLPTSSRRACCQRFLPLCNIF